MKWKIDESRTGIWLTISLDIPDPEPETHEPGIEPASITDETTALHRRPQKPKAA